MDLYGFRAPKEIDCGVARFRQDPSSIVTSVRSLVELQLSSIDDSSKKSRLPDAILAAGVVEADRWLEDACAELKANYWFGGIRAKMLRVSLRVIDNWINIKKTLVHSLPRRLLDVFDCLVD